MSQLAPQSYAAPGAVIGGRYRLIEPIGRGASGEVWRAQHVNLGTFAAVKLVPLGADPEITARVLTEAQAAAALKSAHVVEIYDQGTEGPVAYIAMELLQGESLSDRIQRGPLPGPEVARIIRDIARAVGKAHSVGIIHRDLKPQNVFLTELEGVAIAKVLDFGIAKVLAGKSETREGMVVGTPAYMSPEQVSGEHGVDWRTDLWQMAIIAFECLTGRLPYSATTMAELFVQIAGARTSEALHPGELPPAFDAWFRKATALDPAGRHLAARDLSDELTRALVPNAALDASTLSGLAPWETAAEDPTFQRRMAGVALALAAVATGLIIALGVALSRPSSSDATVSADPAGPPLGAAGEPLPRPDAAIDDGAPPEPPEQPPDPSAEPPPPEPTSSATAVPSVKPPPKPVGRGHDPWGI